jgi:hypothetical protein
MPVARLAASRSPGTNVVDPSTTSNTGRSGRKARASKNARACSREVNETPAIDRETHRQSVARQPRAGEVAWSCANMGVRGTARAS